MTPRQLRQAAGLTQIQAAVYAGASPPPLRMYEASRAAPSEPIQRKLDAYYRRLGASLDAALDAALDASANPGPQAA